MTVTRIHLADLVGDAFGPDGASKNELLAAAAEHDASMAALSHLHQLPDRRFRHMAQLWSFLEDSDDE